MANKNVLTRQGRRLRRHLRVRKKISGTMERPRLVVFRSLNNVEGQVVDDTQGLTVVGLSTRSPQLRDGAADGMSKSDKARAAGKRLAELAREKGVTRVVFDRGGYIYHGRVKAFAEGAREGGLEF
jgi:large subunit ribosomal protein L18